jgi:hypothetical protein
MVEGVKQFAKRTGIGERQGPLARPHLDDTLERQEALAPLLRDRVVSVLLHHERTSSAACMLRHDAERRPKWIPKKPEGMAQRIIASRPASREYGEQSAVTT